MSEQERIGKIRFVLIEASKLIGAAMSVEVLTTLSNAMSEVMDAEGIRLVWQSTFDQAFAELMREDDK